MVKEEIKDKGGGQRKRVRDREREEGEREGGKEEMGVQKERERQFSTYPFIILESDSSHQSNKKKWRKCEGDICGMPTLLEP